jgi:hypothetical protein
MNSSTIFKVLLFIFSYFSKYGIIYLDDDAQQRFLQMPDGNFYKNAATEPNVQIWQPILEETARQEILNNNLHFMLISEGIAPSFLPKENIATVNVVDIVGDDTNPSIHR